ncbi:MAG: hypothetical protein ACP5G2_02660 [Candidatus Bipolaricaulaceae bacterium]
MAGEKELRRHLCTVRRWVRGRGALGGAAVALAACLSAQLGGKLLGASVPLPLWVAVPLTAAWGALRPRDWERELLAAGHRMGVGGRLVAAQLALGQGELAFAQLLWQQVQATRRPRWRLAGSRMVAAGTALSAGFLVALLLVSPMSSPPPPAGSSPAGEPPVTADKSSPEQQGADRDAQRPTATPPPPPLSWEGAQAPSSPYQDVLASVLGLDEPPGGWGAPADLADRLAQQEELLRQLAAGLQRSAAGGLSAAEQSQLMPLADQVARADLRAELARLIEQADQQAVEQARQAVEAVRRAAADAPPPVAHGDEQAVPPTDWPGEQAGGRPAPAHEAGEQSSPGEHGEEDGRLTRLAEAEGQLAGDAPGDEPMGGGDTHLPPAEPGVQVTPPLQSEEDGPVRGYLTAGVPVEPAGAVPGATPAVVPAKAELILRGRGVPPELRGLVRRYFDLITAGSGGGQ